MFSQLNVLVLSTFMLATSWPLFARGSREPEAPQAVGGSRAFVLTINAGVLRAGDDTRAGFTTVEFPSSDGLTITADLYSTGNRRAPMFVLFHQSGSSRGEYRGIAPQLVRMGYNCLAVDLRWGRQDRWNNVLNETARRNGTFEIMDKKQEEKIWPTAFASQKDMAASMRWLKREGYTGKKIVWGSSFSSILVFPLANDFADEVVAVISYSPGEYYKDKPEMVRDWARRVRQPIYIAGGTGEAELITPIYESVSHNRKLLYQASKGRHGSSILFDDASNWDSLKKFLKQFI